ncbi:hypothetical protein SRHO_G00071910 [Serrasalmus rhombeus]
MKALFGMWALMRTKLLQCWSDAVTTGSRRPFLYQLVTVLDTDRLMKLRSNFTAGHFYSSPKAPYENVPPSGSSSFTEKPLGQVRSGRCPRGEELSVVLKSVSARLRVLP